MKSPGKTATEEAKNTRPPIDQGDDPEALRQAALRSAKRLQAGSVLGIFRQVSKQLRRLSPLRKSDAVKRAFDARDALLLVSTSATQTFAMSNFVQSTLRMREGLSPDPAIASASILLMRHCEAIDLLCRAGLDSQAKTILRSAFETIDLLIAMQGDADLRADYIAVDTVEDAGLFWGRYLYRGKLGRTASRLFDEKFPPDALGFNLGEWAKSEINFLNGATHPTHTSGFMGLFGNTFSAYARDGRISPFTLGEDGYHLGTLRTSRSLLLQTFRLLSMYREDAIADFGLAGRGEIAKANVNDLLALATFTLGWIDVSGVLRVEMVEENPPDDLHSFDSSSC